MFLLSQLTRYTVPQSPVKQSVWLNPTIAQTPVKQLVGLNFLQCKSRLWFQPIWNILVKLDHFPKDRGEKKCLKPPSANGTFIISDQPGFAYQPEPPDVSLSKPCIKTCTKIMIFKKNKKKSTSTRNETNIFTLTLSDVDVCHVEKNRGYSDLNRQCLKAGTTRWWCPASRHHGLPVRAWDGCGKNLWKIV